MSRVRYADISIEKSGGWYVCTAITDGYLVTRRYLYYTKREALRLFHQHVNSFK